MALAGTRGRLVAAASVLRGAGVTRASRRASGIADASGELRAAVLEFDESLPRACAVAPPVGWYAQHSIHSLETTAVFGSRWVGVGSAQRVKAPGAYFTGTIGNEPYLIVNDGSTINAFYNVCPHRGSLLVRSASGTVEAFTCHSSGRTYSLDGRRTGLSRSDSACDAAPVTAAASHLGRAAIARYGPALLVHLLQPENPDVTSGGSSRGAWPADNEAQASFLRTVEFKASSNWKLIVECYLSIMKRSNGKLRHDLYFPDRRCSKPPLLPAEVTPGPFESVLPNTFVYVYPNVLIDSGGDGGLIVRYIIPVDAQHSLIETDYFTTRASVNGGKPDDGDVSSILIGRDFVETLNCIRSCEDDQKAMSSKRVQALRKHAAIAADDPGIREFHLMLADDLKEALQLKFDVTI